jgi:predicted dehydrogenase
MSVLNVGIIGVGSPASWGREAHVPAVRAISGLRLAAVATRDQQSADQLADSLGAARGYGSAFELINDPDIHIVTVATPVPTHHDLILAALRAGKHVVTEWPVGTGTAQTAEIAAVAEASGLCTAIDLQSRMNPAAVRASELLQSGAIGRILYATVLSTTGGFGPAVPDSARYLEDPAVGMNLTTIQGAHTIDFALRLTGPLTSLSALTTVQYPELRIGDDATPMHRTIPDHVLVHGRLDGGGALAVQVIGGRPVGETPFRMDIVGDAGALTLTGGALRGFQAGLLNLTVNGKPVLTAPAAPELPESAVNVSHVYAALRDDILNHTVTAPNFLHAVRLSHLIDDVLVSADLGRSVTPTASWPN